MGIRITVTKLFTSALGALGALGVVGVVGVVGVLSLPGPGGVAHAQAAPAQGGAGRTPSSQQQAAVVLAAEDGAFSGGAARVRQLRAQEAALRAQAKRNRELRRQLRQEDEALHPTRMPKILMVGGAGVVAYGAFYYVMPRLPVAPHGGQDEGWPEMQPTLKGLMLTGAGVSVVGFGTWAYRRSQHFNRGPISQLENEYGELKLRIRAVHHETGRAMKLGRLTRRGPLHAGLAWAGRF